MAKLMKQFSPLCVCRNSAEFPNFYLSFNKDSIQIGNSKSLTLFTTGESKKSKFRMDKKATKWQSHLDDQIQVKIEMRIQNYGPKVPEKIPLEILSSFSMCCILYGPWMIYKCFWSYDKMKNQIMLFWQYEDGDGR